jgi:hypothetical protein
MKEKEPKKVMKRGNYTFDYKFTQDEINQKAKQLARASVEKNQIEDEKKSTMSVFTSRIDGKKAEINIISEHINSGRETVTKTCDIEFDYDNQIKVFFFEGAEVGREKMTRSDLQLQIDETEVEDTTSQN